MKILTKQVNGFYLGESKFIIVNISFQLCSNMDDHPIIINLNACTRHYINQRSAYEGVVIDIHA